MTDKEFKRLKHPQLIEIIYELQQEQQKLIEEKNAMEQKLTKEKEELQKQLDEQKIKIEKAGSIAEAAMALTDIFEVAQKTADKYLAEVYAANMVSEQQSKELLASAQRKADSLVAEAQQKSEAIRQETEAEIELQWKQFQQKVADVLTANSVLEKFLDHGRNK